MSSVISYVITILCIIIAGIMGKSVLSLKKEVKQVKKEKEIMQNDNKQRVEIQKEASEKIEQVKSVNTDINAMHDKSVDILHQLSIKRRKTTN